MQIELLRFVSVVVAVFRLREYKKREAFFKPRRWQLAFDDFLYRACKFLLQIGGRLKTRIDPFVDGPKRLAGDKAVAYSTAWPIGKHAVLQQRVGILLHPALKRGAIFGIALLKIWQISQQVCEQTVAEKFRRNLFKAAVRILQNHRKTRDLRQPWRSRNRCGELPTATRPCLGHRAMSIELRTAEQAGHAFLSYNRWRLHWNRDLHCVRHLLI